MFAPHWVVLFLFRSSCMNFKRSKTKNKTDHEVILDETKLVEAGVENVRERDRRGLEAKGGKTTQKLFQKLNRTFPVFLFPLFIPVVPSTWGLFFWTGRMSSKAFFARNQSSEEKNNRECIFAPKLKLNGVVSGSMKPTRNHY